MAKRTQTIQFEGCRGLKHPVDEVWVIALCHARSVTEVTSAHVHCIGFHRDVTFHHKQ